MTALAQDRKTDRYQVEDSVWPLLLSFPIEAATNVYAGGMGATNAAGNMVPASASSALKLWGRIEQQVLNSGGAAGAAQVPVRPGTYYFNSGAGADAIVQANVGSFCYASDDNTVNLTDLGGTRPLAGLIININPNGQIGVLVGVAGASPYNPNIGVTSGTSYRARAVVTTLQAYGGTTTGILTETANGAISAADGVTLAVGDVVLIPEGTTNITAASDAGPYIVTALGSAGTKWVLTRPSWWETGSVIGTTTGLGTIIEVGGEGTVYGGSSWKTFAAKGQIIDTNAPLLWPRILTKAITLAAGFFTTLGMPLRSLTTSGIMFQPTSIATSTTTASYRTGVYASGGAATVAGAVNTGGAATQSSISITALIAAGTTVADTSTGLLTVTNW